MPFLYLFKDNCFKRILTTKEFVSPFDVVSLVGALAAVDVSTVVFAVVSAIVVRGVIGDIDVGTAMKNQDADIRSTL